MADINRGHYEGLLAEWYDRLVGAHTADVGYYRETLAAEGGPALELACGTGRILIGCLEAGLEVDGLDFAPDMLEVCRRKLEEKGLSARLISGDMARMSLGRKYRTIFVAGSSFQHIGDLETAQAALIRIREHLEPGGLFLAGLAAPWSEIRSDAQGVPRLMGTAENDTGERLIARECTTLDLAEQVKTGHYLYELYRDGELARTLLVPVRMRWYGAHEFTLMLEKAGFDSVDADTHPAFTRAEGAMVVRARNE